MTPFQYDRLDLSRDAIRLVRLVKGKAPEPIRCELYQTYLHKVDGVPYEALSYTWGDDDSSQSTRIILNGQEVCLRPNLHTALDFLRLEDSDRLLWIDAICIDQSYDKEKTHQVNQMRLVYTHAECVLFWLGPSGEHTNDLMDLITDIDRNLMAAKLSKKNWRLAIENTHNDYKIECEHWKVQAARDLVSRPWFSRVWILQEVASARRGTVICGRKSAPARTWALLMPVLLGRDLDDHTRAVLDIIPSPQRSESWWQKRRDLFTLLKKFAHSKSSDPKDKVYALIGISSDAGHNERFLPDYSADMQSFARNTISYILFGDVRSPEHIELPSWTVDALFRYMNDLPQAVFRWAVDNIKPHTLDMLFTLDTKFEPPPLKRGPQHCRDIIIDWKDEHGRTLLSQAAAGAPHAECIRLLLRTGRADVNSEDCNGRTPLWYAIERGHKEIVQLLLRTGNINPELKDERGRTPLSHAIHKGNTEILQLLLQTGNIDPELKDERGRTPLSYAIHKGNTEIVRLLLKISNTTANSKVNRDRTPLLDAIHAGYTEIVQLLLQTESINPDLRDKRGRTPLLHAIHEGNMEIVQLLLKTGNSTTNAKDNRGRTALSYAVSEGRQEIVQLLLQTDSVDPDLKDEQGRTPLWYAMERSHRDIVDLLCATDCVDTEPVDYSGRKPEGKYW